MKIENKIEILKLEYEELNREIRNIHEKRIDIFKSIAIYLVGFIIYSAVGVSFVIDHSINMEKSVIYFYCILGIVISIFLYLLVFTGFMMLGPSKKHTVRAWKCIHGLRQGFVDLDNTLKDYILMPRSETNINRPKISRSWDWLVFIYPLIVIIFYLIFSFLLTPFFAGLKAINSFEYKYFWQSMLNINIIFQLFLVLGITAMKHHMKNIFEARNIKTDNLFPNVVLKLKSTLIQKIHYLFGLISLIMSFFILYIYSRTPQFTANLINLWETTAIINFISMSYYKMLILFVCLNTGISIISCILYLYNHSLLGEVTIRNPFRKMFV